MRNVHFVPCKYKIYLKYSDTYKNERQSEKFLFLTPYFNFPIVQCVNVLGKSSANCICSICSIIVALLHCYIVALLQAVSAFWDLATARSSCRQYSLQLASATGFLWFYFVCLKWRFCLKYWRFQSFSEIFLSNWKEILRFYSGIGWSSLSIHSYLFSTLSPPTTLDSHILTRSLILIKLN